MERTVADFHGCLNSLRDALAVTLPADRMSVGASDRAIHGRDSSLLPDAPPDLVVYPQTTSEVAEVLAAANRLGVPVVPFGAGSSLEGGVLALHGGISLDMSRMDRLRSVSRDDLTAVVEPGITRLELERTLGEQGLEFPIDPGADASLGGMAATNAAGTMTLRHGKMRDRVLGLEAVLPSGRTVRTGSGARKTSAGYDLTSLLIGSEGTLGVITELTIRLEPIPESTRTIRASFATVDSACQAAIETTLLGAAVRRVEFMDAWEVAAVNGFSGEHLSESPLLLIELAGDRTTVRSLDQDVRDVLDGQGAVGVASESDNTLQRRLWRVRHRAYDAEKAMAPGKESVATDVCVPRSCLSEIITRSQHRLAELGLQGGVVAHAGDGNPHVGVLVDLSSPFDLERLERFRAGVVADALNVGGTCTGEHGVGAGKLAALGLEHADLLDLYAGIKSLFDPNRIMNPGKVVPPPTVSAPKSG